MRTAGTVCSSIVVAIGLALFACHPPSPAAPPSPPLPTPLNPTSRDVAQEILDASIVSEAALQADVASLDSGAIPTGTF
jgi:hypothetical protein